MADVPKEEPEETEEGGGEDVEAEAKVEFKPLIEVVISRVPLAPMPTVGFHLRRFAMRARRSARSSAAGLAVMGLSACGCSCLI